MTILKFIPTANGDSNVHRLELATLSLAGPEPELRLQIRSYPNQADANSRQNLLWQEYPIVPLTALDVNDPVGSLERAACEATTGYFAGGTWESDVILDTLENAKARKWEEIKKERQKTETGGFDMPGIGRFDSDAASRNKIVGSVLAAQIAETNKQPFSIDWTLADNTSTTLDGPGMIAVGLTLLKHIDEVHQKSRRLYALIESAETVEDVQNINWNESTEEQNGNQPENPANPVQ